MEKKKNTKRWFIIACLILVVVLTLLDQFTKSLAVKYLQNQESISLIDGVLQLQYVENRGAAFGILQNSQLFFTIVTLIILGAIVYVWYKMPAVKKYFILYILLACLSAGAVGNLIDRVFKAYVVDFIYFSLIDFPVFNMADIYVTVSTALIILLSLFKYRDDEFSFLRFRNKKNAEICPETHEDLNEAGSSNAKAPSAEADKEDLFASEEDTGEGRDTESEDT